MLLGFFRFRPVLYPAAYVWLAVHMSVPLISLAWRQLHHSSWARWREVPAALVRGYVFGGGVTWRVVDSILSAELAAQDPRAVLSSQALLLAIVNLVNSSAAFWLVLFWFKPLRFG